MSMISSSLVDVRSIDLCCVTYLIVVQHAKLNIPGGC